MGKYQKFEELPVWQEASKLYNRVLDVLEESKPPFSPAFRNQLERASLSVSNNIAEGFERVTTSELNSFLAIARGSAGEVRSMIAVISNRPRLKTFVPQLREIRSLAESCARQITAWVGANDASKVQGKRHLTPEIKHRREVAEKAKEYRRKFLREMRPTHPLYNTEEARRARGELDYG
jgi:S23 ribosomal protein.